MLQSGRETRVKPWFAGPYECVYIYGVAGVANKYNRKKQYIHKLVYNHFGKMTETKARRFVHHKDGDERNNDIQNLTLTTLEQNLKARKFYYTNKNGEAQRRSRGKKNSEVSGQLQIRPAV